MLFDSLSFYKVTSLWTYLRNDKEVNTQSVAFKYSLLVYTQSTTVPLGLPSYIGVLPKHFTTLDYQLILSSYTESQLYFYLDILHSPVPSLFRFIKRSTSYRDSLLYLRLVYISVLI